MHNAVPSTENPKFPKVPPKCAESQSLIDELNHAVATSDRDQRLRILERITDLFAAGSRGYSSDQIALFDDVLEQLSAEIEVTARARLSRRLVQINSGPPKLIRSLAFDDEIKVAEPVLLHSQQLNDADLVENAATKSQAHLFAIAQRLKLSEPVTDVLVKRGNRRVIYRVIRNDGARFSLSGYRRLTIRARDNGRLALALGQRGDLPRQYFLKLLETASASVRAKLENADPQAGAAIRDTIDDVATTLQQETREASGHHAVAVRDGRRRSNISPFTEANIHASAHVQAFERTVFAFSELGHFPVDLVERALLDKGEDMVLILARATGCSWTTVKKLLLMYVAERDLHPDDLERAFARYKKLHKKTARTIISFYERRLKLRTQEKLGAGISGTA